MYFRKETRHAMAPWTWKWFMTSSESMRQVRNSSFINIIFCVLIIYHVYRVSKKMAKNRMMLEPWCTGSITSGRHPLGLENVFGRLIILRLCRIMCSPVMCLVKFSPTAFNFSYDFVLLVTFLGHPASSSYIYIYYVVYEAINPQQIDFNVKLFTFVRVLAGFLILMIFIAKINDFHRGNQSVNSRTRLPLVWRRPRTKKGFYPFETWFVGHFFFSKIQFP